MAVIGSKWHDSEVDVDVDVDAESHAEPHADVNADADACADADAEDESGDSQCNGPPSMAVIGCQCQNNVHTSSQPTA